MIANFLAATASLFSTFLIGALKENACVRNHAKVETCRTKFWQNLSDHAEY